MEANMGSGRVAQVIPAKVVPLLGTMTDTRLSTWIRAEWGLSVTPWIIMSRRREMGIPLWRDACVPEWYPEMSALRVSGHTLEKIGGVFGMTKEGVRQSIKRGDAVLGVARSRRGKIL